MRLAICGNPNIAQQIRKLVTGDVEFKFFVRDFVGTPNDIPANFTPISFFEFRRLISYGELDGLIIAANGQSFFTKQVVQTCKLYQIPHVGVLSLQGIYWLNASKIFLPYLEADITDKCNLHCAGCYHFANFSVTEEFYPLENFRRDMEQLSRTCDLLVFRLMGGESMLMENFDEYINFTRQCLPNVEMEILTNGTLIPTLPQKMLDALRENHCYLEISTYPPTMKVADKIKALLDANEIRYHFSELIEKFNATLTLNDSHNPSVSRKFCCNDYCRTVRNGKIYKCPPDAFSYKFAERFGIEGFPQSVGIDIYAPNFSSMFDMLDGNVEMCYWCSERAREIPWQPTNNPRLEDWLADPDELKNFL